MRKFISFILVLLLAFNWFGYKVAVQISEIGCDKKLEESINQSNYSADDVMLLKIPLHLPYQNSSLSYQRVDGELNFKGVYYRYVKQKVIDDTLFIVCLRNTEKTHLEFAKQDFSKNYSDTSKPDHSSKTGKLKKAIDDFERHDISGHLSVFIPFYNAYFKADHSVLLPSALCRLVEQPPDVILS